MTPAIDASRTVDSRKQEDPATRRHVYAVIPVFNRLPLTTDCLAQLARQSYRPITAIVVDGGSTDDTVATIRRDYPDVVLLTSKKPLFWAGATRLGIDWALANADPEAFVLLLNNDTKFGPGYVEDLVELSRREGAAVGGINVDSRDMTTPVNAGVKIDWLSYGFPPKSTIDPPKSTVDPPRPTVGPPRSTIADGHVFDDDVDVLNGRGVLVPLAMIRQAGNVDDVAFPHYIADYDFFCRLRAHGFRLGIHQKAVIGMMIAESGLDPTIQDKSFTDWARSLFDRRSRHNIVDHWRFIGRHAPGRHRARLKRLLIKRALGQLVDLLLPPDSVCGRVNMMLRAVAGSLINHGDGLDRRLK